MSSGQNARAGAFASLAIAWFTFSGMAAVGLSATPEGRKLKNPIKATADSVAAGQVVFQKYCRFCHGPDATGDGPLAPKGTHPPNLVDATWDHGSTDGEIFLNIRDGIGPKFDMKPNKDKISEADIWNVVNYLRSIGTTKK
jgi:mono/diheme cytochrome c family protein